MASIPEALRTAIQQQHEAANEFLKGNAAPWKKICSHRDDVTILGGWGGHERGWAEEVERRYDWASARCGDVIDGIHFENVSLIVTPELAYSVDIERSRVRLRGMDQEVPIGLRVTTIFRLEDSEWKMVHRHADPLLTIQDASAMIQKS